MRDHVLLATCVFNVLLKEVEVTQVYDPQTAAPRLVFIGGADASRCSSDLDPARSILRCQLNHAVIRQDHMSTVADEQVAVHLHAGVAQRRDFLQESHWIEHHSVTDNGAAALAKNATRHELQYKSLTVDDYGMTGIVAPSVTHHD